MGFAQFLCKICLKDVLRSQFLSKQTYDPFIYNNNLAGYSSISCSYKLNSLSPRIFKSSKTNFISTCNSRFPEKNSRQIKQY